MSCKLPELLADVSPHRLILELTEHAAVSDYEALLDALEPLRPRVLLAIDDAGAGFSSLRHILMLKPDIIKLDISLTRDIDQDPAKQALATALVAFARQLTCSVVAEGVETADELKALEALGVDKVQGFFLGRPVPLVSLFGMLAATRVC